MTTPQPSTEQIAQAYLENGRLDRNALVALIADLKVAGQFALARRVLDRVATQPPFVTDPQFATWAQQQRALCTYKDAERPPLAALREALGILAAIGLYADDMNDAETLGLGGAIYKRFWDLEGNAANLHAALALYRAGWKRGTQPKKTYCGINAAFLYDLLAHMARRAATGVAGDLRESKRLSRLAAATRRSVLSEIDRQDSRTENGGARSSWAPDYDSWPEANRIEALFGLGRFDEARTAVAELAAQGYRTADWKIASLVRQLVLIANCQGLHPNPESEDPGQQDAAEALRPLLGDELDGALGLTRGRVGLALSGGGFRASFYHLGVLARLAEVDALRHVEVISTVSGGSIVGAMYYLKLKTLIERTDATGKPTEPAHSDYIELVRDLQNEFLAGVSRNLRVRALADLGKNIRMMFTSYSRSLRIGELYEEELYARVDGLQRRTMGDLLISPAGRNEDVGFNPNAVNWRRRTKVPVLLINATALNSGHNFQFTAKWMGEPPGLIGDEIDMNARYRRVYYRNAPTEALRHFPLGHAVAASSGVPMLFAPIRLRGLYPGRTVELVDGGVHDNQGIGGLLDESCDFLICSDASGQMEDDPSPKTGTLAVALRSSDIGQDRVRESEYSDVATRERAGALRGLCFIHLKDGLSASPIDAVDQAPGPPESPQPNQTPYGIDRDIQAALAAIRTDLDSFTEVEASALMLSGYQAMAHQIKHEDRRQRSKGGSGPWGNFEVDAPPGHWEFRRLETIAAKPRDSTDLRRRDLEVQLFIGNKMFFKAFCLVPWLIWPASIAGLSLLSLFGWLLVSYWHASLVVVDVGTLVKAFVGFIAVTFFPGVTYFKPMNKLQQILISLALPIIGWVAANIHLRFIEPLIQRRGSLARLLALPEQT